MENLNNYAIVNGKRFISEDFLIEQMVKNCVAYTTTDDLEVYEGGATLVSAYQSLLRNLNFQSTQEKFRNKYVGERFIKRTIGV